MRTTEQIEKDYQLGKDLQKLGYIKTDREVNPRLLAGEMIKRRMRERNLSLVGFLGIRTKEI